MSEDDWLKALDAISGNERIVVEIALAVMSGKGWIGEPDIDLIDTLSRLYQTHEVCQGTVKFNGELMHDLCAGRPGEYLAHAWEREREEDWERYEAPRWSCPCGVLYGLVESYYPRVIFYTLTEDGVFDEQVTECPGCTRDLETVRREVASGQLGLF